MSEIKKTDMFMIPLSLIEANQANNGRFAPRGEVDALAASIKEYGQKQPVGVKRLKGDNFTLVYGYGRYEAMKLINENQPEDMQIPIKAVIVRENDQEQFISNLVENVERQNLSAMDYAMNLRRLIDTYGWTQTKCAEFFRKTQGWVSATLTLCELNYDVQEQVHAGVITWADAVEMARNLEPDQQREVLAAINTAAAEVKEAVAANPEVKKEDKEKKVKQAAKAAGKQAVAKATGKKPYTTPASKKDPKPVAATGKRSWGELHDFFEQMMNANHFSKEVRTSISIILKGMEGGIREDDEFARMLATSIDRKEMTAEVGGAA